MCDCLLLCVYSSRIIIVLHFHSVCILTLILLFEYWTDSYVLIYTNSSMQFSLWVMYCSVSFWRSALSSKVTWLFLHACHELSPHYIYCFHTVLKYLFLVLLLLLFAFVFILFHKNVEHTYINLAAFCQKLFLGLVKNIHSLDEFYILLWSQCCF